MCKLTREAPPGRRVRGPPAAPARLLPLLHIDVAELLSPSTMLSVYAPRQAARASGLGPASCSFEMTIDKPTDCISHQDSAARASASGPPSSSCERLAQGWPSTTASSVITISSRNAGYVAFAAASLAEAAL